LLESIREGRTDLGIGVHEPEAAENDDLLRYQNLFEDEIVVVIRRDDPLAKRKSVDWSKLVDRDLAVFVRGSVSDALQRTGMAEKLRLTAAYRMEYTESLYALVRNGLAVAVLPSLYTMHLHDPELIALRLDKPRVTRAIALISLADDDRGRTCAHAANGSQRTSDSFRSRLKRLAASEHHYTDLENKK